MLYLPNLALRATCPHPVMLFPPHNEVAGACINDVHITPMKAVDAAGARLYFPVVMHGHSRFAASASLPGQRHRGHLAPSISSPSHFSNTYSSKVQDRWMPLPLHCISPPGTTFPARLSLENLTSMQALPFRGGPEAICIASQDPPNFSDRAADLLEISGLARPEVVVLRHRVFFSQDFDV